MRIGQGYDVHKLTPDRPLWLGCINIPHPTGLLGHSDADVCAHAIIDALLGAAALGDIGRLFPDNQATYKDAPGHMLLALTADLLKQNNYQIINIDCTIVAQAPKLAPYIPNMQLATAKALSITSDKINIKATTEENLGFTGKKQGIAAHAVCLIQSIS